MRRYLTLVCLLFLTIPAGISISGCIRNPAGNYCNGLGYGLKDTDLYSIDLEPRTTGISLAFGQTRQISAPSALTCKGASAGVQRYSYGTTNNQLVDISPTGNLCAGTWNRNSGGGIADFTICNLPSPTPKTGGLPYGTAYISASAQAVTSNPVEVYVHAPVSSVTLALPSLGTGPQQCFSQGASTQLDAQACYSLNGQQVLMCAPSTVTSSGYVCPPPAGVKSVPDCSASVGTLTYTVGNATVASLNSATNVITANLPGTAVITASLAGSGSSAGYFTTCPPKSISVTLNGNSAGPVTVTKGVTQNLTTTVTDTAGNTITGLTLDYQSTNPLNITAGSGGAITAKFPGQASIYAICQPTTCNPAPINELGLFGSGLSISSNPITVTTPGTASAYMWFAAPGRSQYFVPVLLLTGTVGSTVRLPYVPNSMVMDQSGTDLYFGSARALMVFSTASDTIAKSPDPNVPGVVLAVSPDNHLVLINDQVRQVFYLYSPASSTFTTFGGVGSSASWTPDSKTLYITDSAALNNLPENVAAGITGHSDTVYVYNVNTGWTSCAAGSPCAANFSGAQSLAVTIPGVGAYLSGSQTVSRTWCPIGTVGDTASMVFYPQGDTVSAQTDVLTATTDGQHILGAAVSGGAATLTDIGVTIPTTECPGAGSNTLTALSTNGKVLATKPLTISATSVNQVVPSPASNLAFVTYNGSTPGASLPYYIPGSGGAPGTVNYVTLAGSSAITAPVTGAFSPDDTLFFVSTAGDNLIHYIDVKTLTDTQQINPNLPACTPGSDPDCLFTSPATGTVPATVIAVKPRATT